MEIEKLHIKNYRSIKNSGDILFTKLFAFIGKNNAGKSSILRAIQLLFGEEEISSTDFYNNCMSQIEIVAVLKNFQDEKYNELIKPETQKSEIKYIASKKESDDIEIKYFINGEEFKKTTFCKKLPKLLIIKDIRNPRGEATGSKDSYLNKLISQLEETLEEEEANIREIKNKLESFRQSKIKEISVSITENFRNILPDEKLVDK